MLELTSDVGVADGRWHTVLAKFNPTYMEITVDGKTETLRPSAAAAGRGKGNREDAVQCRLQAGQGEGDWDAGNAPGASALSCFRLKIDPSCGPKMGPVSPPLNDKFSINWPDKKMVS